MSIERITELNTLAKMFDVDLILGVSWLGHIQIEFCLGMDRPRWSYHVTTMDEAEQHARLIMTGDDPYDQL